MCDMGPVQTSKFCYHYYCCSLWTGSLFREKNSEEREGKEQRPVHRLPLLLLLLLTHSPISKIIKHYYCHHTTSHNQSRHDANNDINHSSWRVAFRSFVCFKHALFVAHSCTGTWDGRVRRSLLRWFGGSSRSFRVIYICVRDGRWCCCSRGTACFYPRQSWLSCRPGKQRCSCAVARWRCCGRGTVCLWWHRCCSCVVSFGSSYARRSNMVCYAWTERHFTFSESLS